MNVSRRARRSSISTRCSTQYRDAGLPVELVVEGTERPLPPGLDLAAYRVVQEALTNTLKHAAGATAAVAVAYGTESLELTVSVSDSGCGEGAARRLRRAGGDGGGHGLVGMRERAEIYGGRLEAGPSRVGRLLRVGAVPTRAEPRDEAPARRCSAVTGATCSSSLAFLAGRRGAHLAHPVGPERRCRSTSTTRRAGSRSRSSRSGRCRCSSGDAPASSPGSRSSSRVAALAVIDRDATDSIVLFVIAPRRLGRDRAPRGSARGDRRRRRRARRAARPDSRHERRARRVGRLRRRSSSPGARSPAGRSCGASPSGTRCSRPGPRSSSAFTPSRPPPRSPRSARGSRTSCTT